MSNVVNLPQMIRAERYEDMCRARQEMVRAMQEWIRSGVQPELVRDEVDGTISALRQIMEIVRAG